MPVYNAERLLGECLAAVNASTFRDYEIVVVDDSSTDKSREIAASYGARVVPSGGRLGPGRARNKGVEHARGDIVFFIDSDVVVRPDTLARLATAFDRDPGVSGLMRAVAGDAFRTSAASTRISGCTTYVRRAGKTCHFLRPRQRSAVPSSRRAVRRNYVDPNIEDTDYGQKLASQGFRVQILPDLEVEHVKGYDLAGLLRVDFLRSMSLARLKLRKSADGIGTNDTSVPTGYILSVPLAGLAVLLLLIGLVLGNRTC
jgi:glycosyltransferase involved in cell wall biosynthesis